MRRFAYTVLARGTGLALADALVTIYLAGTTDKVSLYVENDVNGEELPNPLSTNAYGEVAAYIPNGLYDLRVDHAAQPTRTIPDVQVYDLTETAAATGPLATVQGAANQLPYFSGTNVVGMADFTNLGRAIIGQTTAGAVFDELAVSPFVQSLFDDADAAEFRASIGAGGPGPAGPSAYQVAVDEGFAGTEAEWLASLQGPPGDFTYNVPFGFTTAPDPLAVVLIHTFTESVEFPENFAGATGSCQVLPTGAQAFTVKHNWADVGTVTIGTDGAFTFATTAPALYFNPGDVLAVVAPAGQDAMLLNVGVTFKGTRS